jgi:deoxyribodipyrimidine photo-lyase
MSRDCRVHNNWALIYSVTLAKKYNEGLTVFFNLRPNLKNKYERHLDFLLQGLQQVEEECNSVNIPFKIIYGQTPEILAFIKENKIGYLVSDFNPLRSPTNWKTSVNKKIEQLDQKLLRNYLNF